MENFWPTPVGPCRGPNHVRRSFFGLFLGVGSWVPKVAFWACFGQFGALPFRAVPIVRFRALPAVVPAVPGSVAGRSRYLRFCPQGVAASVISQSIFPVLVQFGLCSVDFPSVRGVACVSMLGHELAVLSNRWRALVRRIVRFFVGPVSSWPAVRAVPRFGFRPGSVGSWLALPGAWVLPGFGPGGAIMCDIGFLVAVRFFGRPVVRVAVPGGPGKFGFCSFGFCSVWPLPYQSTN